MYVMPTQQALQDAMGSLFQLWIGEDQALDAQLLAVTDGVAMSPRYQCFSADFALPHGVVLPQAVFRLSPPGEEGWLLLMTPTLPDTDGRPVLQAVFHMDRPA
ncbi:DUF6916 family protein [Pseudomonas sp. LS_1]|uniref:DUF6916 family protein n=1 Tax=unclassified Pseudomonas TaxID=196821 RepID=UPI0035BFC2E7